VDEAAPSGLGFATPQALKSAAGHTDHGMGRITSVEACFSVYAKSIKQQKREFFCGLNSLLRI
jgi:RNA-splicing ligase RtcB